MMTTGTSPRPSPALATLAAALALAVAGCAEQETAIVVDLELAGLEIPADVDLLRVELLGAADEEPTVLEFDEVELARHEELSLAVVRSDEAVTGVQVTAQAFGPMPEDAMQIAGLTQGRVSLGVRSDWVAFADGSIVHHEITFEPASSCADRDGDLFFAGPDCDAEGWDCDDLDSEVYPGAAETCDGRDADCDGTDAWLQQVGFEERNAACEGWKPVGLCELFDVECVDGEWACPRLQLPENDDCGRFIDMNCDGELSCGCTEGDVGTMPCYGSDVYFECGTQVCRGGAFTCEPPPVSHFEGEGCVDDSMACGESGSWTCVQDPESLRFEWFCQSWGETMPTSEICNLSGFDDDCDGLVDGDDTVSCPLGGAIGWSCSATPDSVGCLNVLGGAEWICRSPLTVTLDLPLPEGDFRRVTPIVGCANCDSTFCSFPATSFEPTAAFELALVVEITCSFGGDALGLPFDIINFAATSQDVELWIGFEISGTSADAGSYQPQPVMVSLPEGAWDPTLSDTDRVRADCTFSPVYAGE